MKNIGVATLVVLVAIVFGFVFANQIGNGSEDLANLFFENSYVEDPIVAGESVTNPVPNAAKSDNTDQIESDVGGVNFQTLENENAKIEAQLNGL